MTFHGHSRKFVLVGVMLASSLLAASCTNPPPAGGFTYRFQAEKITNTSFVGDWPATFWDPDVNEEPYLVHLGLRLRLSSPVSVTTSVASTYLNGGAVIGSMGAGDTLNIPPGDGLTFSGLTLPDTVDLGNGAPLEIVGSVEFLLESDQLIKFGLAQVLDSVSGLINTALQPILEKGGLPGDAQGIVNYIGLILPSVFTTVAAVVGTALSGIAGGDQVLGVSPKFFLAVGGGLAAVLNDALPSIIDLVNFALSTQNPNPFPNGLPISIGVVGYGVQTSYGTAPATSTYTVQYGWQRL